MINGFSQRDIQAENCCLFAFFDVFPKKHTQPLVHHGWKKNPTHNKKQSPSESMEKQNVKGGRTVEIETLKVWDWSHGSEHNWTSSWRHVESRAPWPGRLVSRGGSVCVRGRGEDIASITLWIALWWPYCYRSLPQYLCTVILQLSHAMHHCLPWFDFFFNMLYHLRTYIYHAKKCTHEVCCNYA